jgi:hypothetical protein
MGIQEGGYMKSPLAPTLACEHSCNDINLYNLKQEYVFTLHHWGIDPGYIKCIKIPARVTSMSQSSSPFKATPDSICHEIPTTYCFAAVGCLKRIRRRCYFFTSVPWVTLVGENYPCSSLYAWSPNVLVNMCSFVAINVTQPKSTTVVTNYKRHAGQPHCWGRHSHCRILWGAPPAIFALANVVAMPVSVSGESKDGGHHPKEGEEDGSQRPNTSSTTCDGWGA